ncbi:protein disulfide-isomerase A6-like [Carcharodon carcharias]|uniref:protein disulfide-isomerase A6-like n=1 Tax=Carcharodon carcharias TaxID=13397 RepID=UPI001B7E747F|nr:protein disulfide-isomerase A6-like [Carcharodon carcharias]
MCHGSQEFTLNLLSVPAILCDVSGITKQLDTLAVDLNCTFQLQSNYYKDKISGIVACTCILTVNAFYSSSNVIKLTSINFNSQVIQSDKLWLVKFYVHWCEHCEQFVSEWNNVATALKGIVKVGAIDVTKYASIGHQYEIEEFPTIKFFGPNKNKPEKYYGGRSSAAITNGVLNSIRFIVKDRLIEQGGLCGSGVQCRRINIKSTFELNDNNFDNQVARGDEIWIVEFSAPWCEYCLSQQPEWANTVAELTRRTKGKVHLAAVDTAINEGLVIRYGIQQVPMIKIFQTNNETVDYNGEKSASSIIAKGLDLYAKMPPYKLFEQMVNEEVLKTTCDHQLLCIIAVLPHIPDTGSNGRSDYLSLLMKMTDKYKKKKWGWLWTEAGAQPKLENALGIGDLMYPTIMAIDARRKKKVLLKSSFNEPGIAEFFRKDFKVLEKDAEDI